MSENNPYSPPTASVAQSTSVQEFALHEPRRVSAGRGWSWIAEGFEHFKSAPGQWILIVIVLLVISIVLALIPFISLLASLISFVWLGGLMLGCKAQDDGESIAFSHLFAGFQNKFGSLLLLSVIYMVAALAIMAAAMGPIFMQLFQLGMEGGDPTALETLMTPSNFLLPILIAMLFLLPLIMCVWFAPALIVLNDVPVFKAMGMSFKGCLKNVVPFLVYGIIALLLYIVAAIPLLLGFLVLGPTLMGSMYRSYKDIYIAT